MKWGRLINNVRDEIGPFHLLREDGSPACGASYFTSTGPYPYEITGPKCRYCEKKEKKNS